MQQLGPDPTDMREASANAALPAPDPRALDRWCQVMNRFAWWFRYSCEGYPNIPTRGPALLVGYHGRPAYDFFILMARMHQYDGRFPWGIAHRLWFGPAPVRRLFQSLAMYDGSPEATTEIVARGEVIALLPGGTRECFRSSKTLYRVDWGRHRGYLKLALQHRLPIVPVASSGVDEFYHIIGDGYKNAKRLLKTDILPLCLPLGIAGVPMGVPRPVRVRQLVGPPIQLSGGPDSVHDPDYLEAAHNQVTTSVQELLDRALDGRPVPDSWHQTGLGDPP